MVTRGQHPSRSCGSAPRESEALPRALSSSRASLRGSYPTLSPHLRLPAPSGLLTTPAQATAGIRCLPPADFHPRHYPQLLEATFTSGPSAPRCSPREGENFFNQLSYIGSPNWEPHPEIQTGGKAVMGRICPLDNGTLLLCSQAIPK